MQQDNLVYIKDKFDCISQESVLRLEEVCRLYNLLYQSHVCNYCGSSLNLFAVTLEKPAYHDYSITTLGIEPYVLSFEYHCTLCCRYHWHILDYEERWAGDILIDNIINSARPIEYFILYDSHK